MSLLPMDLIYPVVSVSGSLGTASVTFNAVTKVFTVTGFPTVFLADEEADPTAIGGSVPSARTCLISFKLNSDGTIDTSGSNSTNLQMLGNVDADGDAVADYSGTLLTGRITHFGFLESGVTDSFNMQFDITASTGFSSAYYGGKSIGVSFALTSSTFTGVFTSDFNGGLAANVFPSTPLPVVPEPSGAGVAFGLMVPPLLARKRRR